MSESKQLLRNHLATPEGKRQRFELVKAALTGILSNHEFAADPQGYAADALLYADAVLAALDKQKDGAAAA